MSDLRYLFRPKGQTWMVRIRVPPSLRERFGHHIVRSTGTSDLAQARLLRWDIVGQIKAAFADAKALRGAEGAERVQLLGKAARKANLSDDEVGAQAAAISKEHGKWQAASFVQMSVGMYKIDEMAERWLEESQFSPNTDREYRYALNLLVEHLGPLQTIHTVTRRDASEFIDEKIRKRGWKSTTANKALGACRGLWDWCIERGYIEASDPYGRPENPWKDLRVRSGRRKGITHGSDPEEHVERRAFTRDEVKALLASNEIKEDARTCMAILAGTGMRVGEALSLEWADINLGTRYVHLDETKTDEPRDVYMPADAAADADSAEDLKTLATALLDMQTRWLELTEPVALDAREAKSDLKELSKWVGSWKAAKIADAAAGDERHQPGEFSGIHIVLKMRRNARQPVLTQAA